MYAEDIHSYTPKPRLVEKVGKYKLLKNTNLMDFYCAVGLEYNRSIMLIAAKPTIEVKYDYVQWTFINHCNVFNTTFTFKFGEEFEDVWPTMTKSTNFVKMKDNHIIVNSRGARGLVINEFEFTPRRLILTQTHERTGTVARRFFVRL